MSKIDLKVDYGPEVDYNPVFRIKGNRKSFCITGSPLDKDWSSYNVEYLRLTDTGDGLIIQFDDMKKPLHLNYCQAEKLRVALKVNHPEGKLTEIKESRFEKL